MDKFKLTKSEARFADLIWSNAPLTSTKLVKIAEQEMRWKKSTTYTVLKTLCEKGIFQNESAMVSAVLTREEFYSRQSRHYVDDTFEGSLPRFLVSFIGGKSLSASQAEELKRLIDEHKEE
jgi:predicted transcriptional regulator